jgi:hypothetical protein
MKKLFVLMITGILLTAGTLKENNLTGLNIEIQDGMTRCITPSVRGVDRTVETKIYDRSRAEVLWVDRNHQYAIAEHIAISGNGMFIQAGWWLNNKRTSLYRTLGSNTPSWTCPMSLTEWYLPVDMSATAEDIAAGGTSEPLYSFSSSSPATKWQYFLPGGYKTATSAQGTTVAVSDDGTVYGVVASLAGSGKLFILNQAGDTIRTITFNPNSGIYGLDITDNGSLFCVSTYYAIYVYDINGTRRDSIANYGQTPAKISSADGKYVVTGDFNGRAYLYHWTGSAYTLKWQHQTGHPWVTSVAVSDSGSTIMVGTFNYTSPYWGKALMYDSSSATPLWEYTQYGDYVDDCALSCSGQRGVAGSWGRYAGTYGDVVTVFNKGSSTPIFQLLDDVDEPGSIGCVDISKDGSFVTAGGKAVHAREMGNGGEVYAIRILDPLANDVGVVSIGAPGSFVQTGQSIAPQATVKNYGLASATFNTICAIYDSFNVRLYADTIAVNNLASGAEQVVSFSPNWTVPAYGRYSTIVNTALAGDAYPANDTLKKNSICFHDGAVTMISYPFTELTLNYSRSPLVTIMNNGSYTENISVKCDIYDESNVLVYTGSGLSYLTPLQSATLWLNPAWTPNDTQVYTSYFYTDVTDDYNHANDSMNTSTTVTTEIMYDDGLLNIYGYVSGTYYDNKFASRMIPCLPAPYDITWARFYASTNAPIVVSLNADSSGLPGLGASYYIAAPDTITPSGTGWAVDNYNPAISMANNNPFWFVVHWLSTSPSAPYVGMDNNLPRDSMSYWYWTESSSPGWHMWTSYDFMMRVMTALPTGVADNALAPIERFVLFTPAPNPFARSIRIAFNAPRSGAVKMNIYDALGRLVTNLYDGIAAPGMHRVAWQGDDAQHRQLSAGIYFLQVEYEKTLISRKLIMVR